MDRFEIIRALSQGGMADLFLARERTCVGSERLVALKRLRPRYAGEPDFTAMFLDECRLALELEHPNIVRAYGVDEWDGATCLALEYLKGVDVGTLIAHDERGRGSGLEGAVAIAHAVADALAHAHSLGVVHRDISPANVFLCRDGSVKLIDFAVAAGRRGDRRTPTGVLKGKYAYMSPEQCRAETLDGRSDLFSLGILLYELATGQRPFRATRSVDVVREILAQPIRRPRSIDPAFPADLEELLVGMLEKERDRRPSSAAQVTEALVAIARRHGYTLARSGLAAQVSRLSEDEPVRRRAPSDTLPNPASDELAAAGKRLLEPVVLVVDDEESFHAVARKRLQPYRRIAAYTAVQAMDALAAQPIDVVLLDLNLPDRSGLEVLEELRALGGDIAVIVCTAEADVGLAVECMKRGASDYLVKSHESFAALGSRVQSALRRRGTPPFGVGTR
ncbi:MAG TPA: protein kinase [Kofleriaceae bacterium]|nr:protein kinase [Kofleriaceae bacterium]